MRWLDNITESVDMNQQTLGDSKGQGSLGCYAAAAAKSLQLCLTLWTPWTAVQQASLSFTISQSLLKFVSIE